jgi:hypothetical protein
MQQSGAQAPSVPMGKIVRQLQEGESFFEMACTENLQRKTRNQIGLEGLPLIFSASLLPGIHKTLT